MNQVIVHIDGQVIKHLSQFLTKLFEVPLFYKAFAILCWFILAVLSWWKEVVLHLPFNDILVNQAQTKHPMQDTMPGKPAFSVSHHFMTLPWKA